MSREQRFFSSKGNGSDMNIFHRVRTILSLPVAILIVSTCMTGLFTVDSRAGESRRLKQEVELDLSFARLQERIVLQGLDPEETRDAMARWHTEHAAELEAMRNHIIATHKARQGPTHALLEDAPNPQGMDTREFVSAAQEHFRRGLQACSSDQITGGNPEKARDKLSEWMAQPAQVQLAAHLRAVRKQISSELSQVERAPAPALSEEDLSALDPEMRIQEEIYARLWALYATPLAEDEEDRDRLGQLEAFHKEKLEELAAIRRERMPERAAARVKALEKELAEMQCKN